MELVVIVWLVGCFCLAYGIYLLKQKSDLEIKWTETTKAGKIKKRTSTEARVRDYSNRLGKRFPDLKTLITPMDIGERLDFAGNPYNINADTFYGLQIFFCGVAAFWGFTMGFFTGRLQLGLIGMLVFGIIGLFGPLAWLNNKIQNRQSEISLTMPDSIDLLATSMEAGLGFDPALKYIVERIKGPLAEEFGRFLNELRLGVPRQECFRHLYARNSSKDLRIVVGALLTAYELGAPISKILQDQAEEMRVQRIQRAKEAGAKASPKISLVTTILIAPAVMMMFVAVLGYHLWNNVGPLLADFGGR